MCLLSQMFCLYFIFLLAVHIHIDYFSIFLFCFSLILHCILFEFLCVILIITYTCMYINVRLELQVKHINWRQTYIPSVQKSGGYQPDGPRMIRGLYDNFPFVSGTVNGCFFRHRQSMVIDIINYKFRFLYSISLQGGWGKIIIYCRIFHHTPTGGYPPDIRADGIGLPAPMYANVSKYIYIHISDNPLSGRYRLTSCFT